MIDGEYGIALTCLSQIEAEEIRRGQGESVTNNAGDIIAAYKVYVLLASVRYDALTRRLQQTACRQSGRQRSHRLLRSSHYCQTTLDAGSCRFAQGQGAEGRVPLPRRVLERREDYKEGRRFLSVVSQCSALDQLNYLTPLFERCTTEESAIEAIITRQCYRRAIPSLLPSCLFKLFELCGNDRSQPVLC